MNTQALKRWPWPALKLRTSLTLTVLLLAAGAAALALKPQAQTEAVVRPFAQSIPTSFGDWREVKSAFAQVDPTVTRSGETSLNQPYDDILARTYQNSRGEVVMLSLAYGRQQRQEVKIHRPDLCYTAQGFKVASLAGVALPVHHARWRGSAGQAHEGGAGRARGWLHRAGELLDSHRQRLQ